MATRAVRVAAGIAGCALAALTLAGCSSANDTVLGNRPTSSDAGSGAPTPAPHPTIGPNSTSTMTPGSGESPTGSAGGGDGTGSGPAPELPASAYPWHTNIASTTFWVGEIFDPKASDGSQVLSTYDSKWQESYGGCDGVTSGGGCETEARSAANGYFPLHMTPKENPFYLDLPFDDINDSKAFAMRDKVIPWAGQAPYSDHVGDRNFSYLKNRWVELHRDGRVCYAQIEDAGPALYSDSNYVFGTNDARPANTKYNGAGMDVSPAVNSCLGYAELDGDSDRVDWRFIEAGDVPPGPWLNVVTTSPVR